MKYLIVGSGGREHTIAWRLLHDGSAQEVYAAPGNGGFEESFHTGIAIDDFEGIARFSKDNNIDMVVVGPEAPLVDGIVDFLETQKIPVFGPSKEAAMLEGSKLFAKKIMEKYNIPTANHQDFIGKTDLLKYIETVSSYPIVIKLDGLAAGKGVGIPENKNEAMQFINDNVKDDTEVFIEDFIEGEEASVLCISDGKKIIPFIAAQDHKRIFEGDRGPNTGGMGAYAPAPIMTTERLQFVYKDILQATIDGMQGEGIPFKGILYSGIIVKGDDIYVLEFNVRFGDPEAQVILPLMKGKLGDVIQKATRGTLGDMEISFWDKHAITVVMSSGGYPGSYEKGLEISGLDTVSNDIIIFHAGTKLKNGKYLTNGGRVLNITAMADSLSKAQNKVYREIDRISFKNCYYRKDIAYKAL